MARHAARPARAGIFRGWKKLMAATVAGIIALTGAGVFLAAPANAAGGPEVTWTYANGSATLTLPASDAWEVKQIVPVQQIFCGENYGNPCATNTFTLSVAAGTCVTVQVDWAGRHGYNSDDYEFCAPKKEDPKPPVDPEPPVPPVETPKKVFVCKFVGTPGVDERLQTGQNPISVSVNAIQNNQWDGVVPGWFSDAHDRSFVLAYDTGQPKPDVSGCPQPEGPPEPECIQKPTFVYTFDGVGSGTVTASAKGGKQGDVLCDPLAVRAATYEYDRPASGNPSWPQTPYGTPDDVLVDTIGTFPYAAPALDTCRQHDIYAEFVSKGGFDELTIPEKLLGPNNPFEPKFLHQALAGKGPNPTYSSTTSEGCNIPDPEPEIVTGTATFTQLSCTEGSANSAKADAVPGGVWTISADGVDSISLPIGEGYDGGVPDGFPFDDITFTLSDGDAKDLFTVTPWTGTWTPVDPTSLDCRTANAKAWVEVVEGPTCDTDAKPQFWTENATWNDDIVPGSEPNTWVRTATAIDGSKFENGESTIAVTYTLAPATGDCVVNNAKASVEIVAGPTCDAPAKPQFSLENATWTSEALPGDKPNTWKREATAVKGSAFAQGEPSIWVSYVLEPATGKFQSTDPKAPCYKAPALAVTGVDGPVLIGGSLLAVAALVTLGVMLMRAGRRRDNLV